MSDVIAYMQDFLRRINPQPPRALHCGIAVWDRLRSLATPETGFGAAVGGARLHGVPVHVDDGMAAGAWEMREGDVVVGAGNIGPSDPSSLYVPGFGFIVPAQDDAP